MTENKQLPPYSPAQPSPTDTPRKRFGTVIIYIIIATVSLLIQLGLQSWVGNITQGESSAAKMELSILMFMAGSLVAPLLSMIFVQSEPIQARLTKGMLISFGLVAIYLVIIFGVCFVVLRGLCFAHNL